MKRELQILLLDANQKRKADTRLILSFLGERISDLSIKDLDTNIEPEDILCLFIGDISNSDEESLKVQREIFDKLNSWSVDVPVLIFKDGFQGELPNDFHRRVVGRVSYPFKYAELLDFVHQCQIYRGEQHALGSRAFQKKLPLIRSLVGGSPAISHVRELISQVAESDASVLILGESGTGKEIIAHQIHEQSNRQKKSFVPINCGAIPGELLESELFGHEKGSFTGAISARQGRFELAQGGTLFLDEIGDMPLTMQVKLLRVLQEKKFERVGSNKTIQADVRIIAATHRNLEDAIEEGKFRQDLFYRLNVFPIEVPPLRERKEDIPLLINDFIHHLESEDRGVIRMMPGALRVLSEYSWPGNVRELANLIERLIILYPNGMVDANDLPEKMRQGISHLDENEYLHETLSETETLHGNGFDLREYLAHLEVRYIKEALKESGGVVSRAADLLKMRRTTLVEKMRKYKLDKEMLVLES